MIIDLVLLTLFVFLFVCSSFSRPFTLDRYCYGPSPATLFSSLEVFPDDWRTSDPETKSEGSGATFLPPPATQQMSILRARARSTGMFLWQVLSGNLNERSDRYEYFSSTTRPHGTRSGCSDHPAPGCVVVFAYELFCLFGTLGRACALKPFGGFPHHFIFHFLGERTRTGSLSVYEGGRGFKFSPSEAILNKRRRGVVVSNFYATIDLLIRHSHRMGRRLSFEGSNPALVEEGYRSPHHTHTPALYPIPWHRPPFLYPQPYEGFLRLPARAFPLS